MPAALSALGLLCVMLRVGPSFSSCTPSVSTLDLGCHLQWNCSDVSSSTTFTVQTMAQGEEWQNVSECFQISSYSCDVSQAFTDFVVFNLIRLEINHGHGEIQRTSTQLCDPLKDSDARFSPPSVSVSLKERRLQVEVALPCAPPVACESVEEEEEDDKNTALSCCPLTHFLKPNITVTLYNKHDTADTQTLTRVFERSQESLEFGSLVAGQEYCAVARFASSPPSDPQCVHVSSAESLYLAALCGVLIALLLIAVCVLGRQCASSDTRLPKSLMSLQNMDHESPFVGEFEQAAPEDEENSVVLLSIVPFSNLSTLSETQLTRSHSHSLGNGYYASPILQHQAFDEDGDGGSNVETDGGASPDHYPGHLWPSDQTHTTGPACSQEASPHQGDSCIPLSSVRVAGAQKEEMELDDFPKILMKVNIRGGSP
ncbi:uncharacterized protein si:dkeyp-75h12.7 [Colossoma macropomum]|uniref:uncharacterized protein si:dkeyp-75h12.7 n=1 Tax=Colossoma macropomum TaxID=42526 RepID=UPI001863E660|nr:uncharacterized protein si:dkeyp-75h12.7 [Colossoma macropomum]